MGLIWNSTLHRDKPLRSDLARQLQRHRWMNRVSKKRQRQNRERRPMVAGLFPDGRPLCAVWVAIQPDWCTRWADDLHEPLTRARLGSITDPENCVPVCRACHDALTFTPESELQWAYDLRLLVHSWDRGQERAG